jgi:hypothetical protein
VGVLTAQRRLDHQVPVDGGRGTGGENTARRAGAVGERRAARAVAVGFVVTVLGWQGIAAAMDGYHPRKTSILRIPGLWTSLLYAESFGITAQRQNRSVGKRGEIDLFTVYRPPAVPGLQFRVLVSNIFQEPLEGSHHDFRFIVDFELPLL